MATYRLTRIFSLSNGSGREHVQLAGPGWTETAHRVATHLAAGTHQFVAELDGTSYWLRLGTDAGGARNMLAMGSNGTSLSLDELAARLPGAQPVRQPQRLPAGRSLWQRLFPQISTMARA